MWNAKRFHIINCTNFSLHYGTTVQTSVFIMGQLYKLQSSLWDNCINFSLHYGTTVQTSVFIMGQLYKLQSSLWDSLFTDKASLFQCKITIPLSMVEFSISSNLTLSLPTILHFWCSSLTRSFTANNSVFLMLFPYKIGLKKGPNRPKVLF